MRASIDSGQTISADHRVPRHERDTAGLLNWRTLTCRPSRIHAPPGHLTAYHWLSVLFWALYTWPMLPGQWCGQDVAEHQTLRLPCRTRSAWNGPGCSGPGVPPGFGCPRGPAEASPTSWSAGRGQPTRRRQRTTRTRVRNLPWIGPSVSGQGDGPAASPPGPGRATIPVGEFAHAAGPTPAGRPQRCETLKRDCGPVKAPVPDFRIGVNSLS